MDSVHPALLQKYAESGISNVCMNENISVEIKSGAFAIISSHE
jgi:hypothetical protein